MKEKNSFEDLQCETYIDKNIKYNLLYSLFKVFLRNKIFLRKWNLEFNKKIIILIKIIIFLNW